ncbi:hypothetical protein [Candidatus Magnetaquicoccus inordinatus]|uniref:hypothetical protein n=1 Tax=Candidatus Magnetaquicoccus inordinatus TaxID=2496818 RepID=UPI00102C9477|nr:hypothetical protein [Candidatus Magnetaquicoccus inordinatus]
MMTVASVIRKTPVSTLHSYFDARHIDLGGLVNWQDHRTPTSQRLLKAVESLKSDDYAVVAMDFERIEEMTDEVGQSSIAGVIHDGSKLQSFFNSHDRAMWLYLHDEKAFRRAEEVRFAERNRLGQKWTSFVAQKGMTVHDDEECRREFVTRICEMFHTMNAQVEVYQRQQICSNQPTPLITQVVIYREGLPDGVWVFENGTLEMQSRRPVLEAVLTYNPNNGVIEVAGLDSTNRPRLFRVFSEVMLGQRMIGLRVPLRQYDLSSLVAQRTFSTDREDGIASVLVLAVKVHMSNYPGVWFMLGQREDADIGLYEFSKEPEHRVLSQKGIEIVQADLAIRFRPNQENRRGQVIRVSISLPNGCDLKGRTKRERLICEKYLPLWGLVQEV